MRRRILSMFLAILLVVALALNVSATSSEYVELSYVEYYCATTCYAASGYGTTQTMDNTVTVGVYVELYDKNGQLTASAGSYNRTYTAGVTVDNGGVAISYTKSTHKANGSNFNVTMEYAP